MTNPLLQITNLPNHAPAFDQIKNEHYLPALEEAIKEARLNIEAIKNNPDSPNFENTIVALETASEMLGQVTGIFYNQLSAVGGDDLHELAEKIAPLSAAFSNDVTLDENLFKRIKTVHDQKNTLNLNTEQKTVLEDTYKSFIRGGAMLDQSKKDRLRVINLESSTLAPTFMNNVSKSAESFVMIIDDKADLAGLPNTAIDSAKHAAIEKGYEGKWAFTLDYPSFGPFLQFADNRELREKIWRAFSCRAWREEQGYEYDNSENILKIIALRQERAELLGYKNHAEYVLERRMAETTDNVFAFLDKMKAGYKPAAQKELEELKTFAKKIDNLDDLKPWDTGYYSEKLKQERYNFSSEDLRPYFPLNQVLKGCFEHFGKLFDLDFRLSDNYSEWHEDVKVFEVWDHKDNSFVGTLYGDFHPREGKKPGAWKTSYRTQGLFNGKVERPVIAIVCNFTKPTPDKPSLLTHGEVTTLFHEMGHAVHGLLSDVTYRSVSGTSVLWDFVELPSQVQENWCYEKETLDMFASHYESGEKIPVELIEKLRASRNFMGGMFGLRQISLGMLDMTWHTTNPANIGDDVAAFEDKAIEDLKLFPRYAGPTSASFIHIFAGGYSSGYYSYKWAEVLDADTFELFLEKGLYNRDVADKYKAEILSRGGSAHPKVLYNNFRGRDADPSALLRREGLIQKSA